MTLKKKSNPRKFAVPSLVKGIEFPYDSLHENFVVDIKLPETRSDEYDEDYHREKNNEYHGLAMDDRGLLQTSSADWTDLEGQARAMDGCILNISKEVIADIIVMNGSSKLFNSKKRSDDPSSIDDAAPPSIDSHFKSKRSTLHPNRKRKPRWENTEEMDTIQRQLDSQAEPSPSIDSRTPPSIDDDCAARRSKLVTEKSL
ncbi:hypothetical protein F2Q70_00011949 [Brassica cretica]|uniref:Uncharacterized protein n=1 Tax=Brassica cretica TaxID=69181 RepID=A0A8S9MAQ4_BRACR|nr:hypothetical protein F2Q70_00011949 [Brassica cretica]